MERLTKWDMRIFSEENVLLLVKSPRFWAVSLVFAAWLAVLIAGLMAPQAMIGDEVTHYYMLVEQAKDLSTPNFYAKVPTGWGEIETRRYPHVVGWHYIGAWIYRISGGCFAAVQFYHSLFWLQFLIIGYLFVQLFVGVRSWGGLVYVAVMMSLPMAILFSVAFYQDVPMTAQILTSFYLLIRRKWLSATSFMALALTLKLNAVMFLPPFVMVFGWLMFSRLAEHQESSVMVKRGKKGLLCKMAVSLSACIILIGTMWGMDAALRNHAGSNYYLVSVVEKVWKELCLVLPGSAQQSKKIAVNEETAPLKIRKNASSSHLPKLQVIANHPGDLRFPLNWVLYFGGVIWVVAGAGLFAACFRRPPKPKFHVMPLLVGLAYIIPTAVFLKTAPDARFFLPGLPFVLTPLCAMAVSWRFGRLFAAGAVVAALLQGGAVLAKAYELRNVSSGIKEAIAFISQNKPEPQRVFMYPEGNYRLFPVKHEWYFKNGLREFWKGSNDFRLQLLARRKVGGIVIKKHLIKPIDANMHNLGVYPPDFVRDLESDRRFHKVFENASVVIYYLPPPAVGSP